MVLFNYSTKELTAKIVYYGPGLCGKTTNLQFIHGNLPGNVKGKMLSLATKTDRTLFFDFLPIDLGEIRGMKTRVQLYTVPGQVFYNETRKLVLKGADGIVFVADSQQQMLGANAESFKNLEDNLRGHAMSLADMPHVIQFNKRDLPKLAGIEEMNAAINQHNAPFYESVATTGIGVQDTLKAITKLVLLNLTKKYDPRSAAAMAAETTGAVASPVASPPTIVPTIEPAAVDVPAAPMAATPPPSAMPRDVAAPPAQPASATPLDAAAPAANPAAGIPLSKVSPVSDTPAFDVPSDLTVRQPALEPAAPGVPEFHSDEIDELVGEVEQAPEAPMAPAIDRPPVDFGAETLSTFEIDASGLDFEQPTDAGPPPLGGAFEPGEEVAAEASEIAAEVPEVAGEAPEVERLAADGSSARMDQQSEPEWSPDGEMIGPVPVDEFPADAPAEPAGGQLAAAADPAAPQAVAVESEDGPVTLSELAQDADLFDDPTVEVARLAGGGEQEIVIPVELADRERGPVRYRLCVKLRLDPID